MNIKRKWVFLISAVLLILTSREDLCLADDKARDRKTLQGIESVVVKVHAVEAEWRTELAKVGLSESTLHHPLNINCKMPVFRS